MAKLLPYVTPKPIVFRTPNLAYGQVLTEFFRKIGFWVDDVIIVTSWSCF